MLEKLKLNMSENKKCKKCNNDAVIFITGTALRIAAIKGTEGNMQVHGVENMWTLDAYLCSMHFNDVFKAI